MCHSFSSNLYVMRCNNRLSYLTVASLSFGVSHAQAAEPRSQSVSICSSIKFILWGGGGTYQSVFEFNYGAVAPLAHEHVGEVR